MSKLDLSKIIKDAFGIADSILGMLVPWWGRAKIILVKVVGMVEATATTENGDEKRQKAIDAFEERLVEEGFVPEGFEKAIDPVLDWALEWAINALVKYLNKTFGKDWVKIVAPSKIQSAS